MSPTQWIRQEADFIDHWSISGVALLIDRDTEDRTDPMTPRKLGSVLAWMRGLLSTPRRMDRLEEELPSEPGASR